MSDGELVQTMQRLMSIHDEIDALKDDLKTVYADAKSAGFDKSAIGLAIREIRGRAKAEKPDAQERAAIVELYVSAFDNAPRTYVHVPAREEAYPERVSRPAETAGSPSSLPRNGTENSLGNVTNPEGDHVDRSASAQPHSALGGPAILTTAEDAGTGQADATAGLAASEEKPSEAGIGSAVGTGAPSSSEVDRAPVAEPRSIVTSPAYRPRPSDEELEIPAFLRRTAAVAAISAGDAL